MLRRRILLALAGVVLISQSLVAGESRGRVGRSNGNVQTHAKTLSLAAHDALELSVRVVSPSSLPPNGRVRVSVVSGETVHLTKVLHALDGDLFTVFRAPHAGEYAISVKPEESELELFEGNRWREAGYVDELLAAPRAVRWADDAAVDVVIATRTIEHVTTPDGSLVIECEPNNAPEQAQPVMLRETTGDYALHVAGGADDIEYFDNGRVGSELGDDWLRLEFNGPEPRLLTACLTIPDQMVAARIRCYSLPADKATVEPGKTLDVGKEYEEGKNPNERVHQQQEQHRIAINRMMKPGNVYFLRVEANAPGYGLELRVVKPAPFDDPRRAVSHALYDHLGQVASWLNNRPRGASVERRIRDTGNLLGTGCMSCHTQSGVWGPAIPFTMGYRAENAHLFRNLVNICYQSMRPTNVLVDAANNTSLAPLDLGDGPAGTRVAGHSVMSVERFLPPRKLQSKQHLRAANFVLQSGDPGGINAAGPGANVGKGVVFNYTGEIVFEAWKETGNPQFFRALEDKALKVLDVQPKYTDDMAHRVEFLCRYFPQDYLTQAAKVRKLEAEQQDDKPRIPSNVQRRLSEEESKKLWDRIQKQIPADLARLRAIQNADGTWGFNPGVKDGDKWKVEGNNKPEPSPTALALIAFEAAGFGPDDDTVATGVKGLLGLQHPTGFWKGQSQTGFVSTSYALHALSRLFPVDPPKHAAKNFTATENETLPEAIARVRRAANVDDPVLLPVLVTAAGHESPLVRFQAMIGLGGLHADAGVRPLSSGLGDLAKPVREAAQWAMRQTLIDDRGWDAVLSASRSRNDYVRESVAKTLLMRVDGVMPGMSIKWPQLIGLLTDGMNTDPHPAVRAWSIRSAWNWWVWNPPVREAINTAWIDLLKRPESNSLVENSLRYQSQALFIANGHKANSSKQHQYKELADLFRTLNITMQSEYEASPEVGRRMVQRVVSIGATYYKTSGGDGGPGQMGYITEYSSDLFGRAALFYFSDVEKKPDYLSNTGLLQVGLEGSANVRDEDLQQKLIEYSLEGPEKLRPIAAASVSDPRSAQLVAVPERIEPLMRQIHRGANEPPRRAQLSDPILQMFARIKWVIPETLEQQHEVFGYITPEFDRYYLTDELKAMADAAKRGERERAQEANWYLSRRLGDVIGENPDLHIDSMLDFLPDSFEHPQVARLWLPSVEWILTYKRELPAVVPGKLPPIDPLDEVRTRALQLFLDQLREDAEPDTRKLAVTLAQKTVLRRNPEVLTGLEGMLEFEKRGDVVKTAKNVLSQNRSNFVKELTDAVKKEEPKRIDVGDTELPKEFVSDFEYFRDYVTPEMNRVLRGDQRSCFACHGVPGRVPPLELNRPDDAGYLPVAKLLENYRKLQKRVRHDDVERSFLLRKPLNVQSGKEEGHQGGRRYQPEDPGYQILRRWALNQVENAAHLGVGDQSVTATESAGSQ